MLYFTADTHFDHTNVIKYCNRPFKNIDEMNNTIITNWNNTVMPQDTIYHLGDFAFAGTNRVQELINGLNGHIIFVRGNHDKNKISNIEQIILKKNGHRILLIHDPALANCQMLTLCGHVHNVFKIFNGSHKNRFPIINVGVDLWDYKPVSWDQIQNTYMECLKACRT